MTVLPRRLASVLTGRGAALAADGFEVELTALPPIEILQADWCELQERADASFFVSWAWIGRWLAHLPQRVSCSVLKVHLQGRLVGLAIVCRHSLARRGLPGRSRGLFINCTGEPQLDELTIEYNGLLTETGLEHRALRAAVEHLAREPEWDEIFLNGWARTNLLGDPLPARFGLRLIERRQRPCYRVDLRALRDADRSYVDSLPSKIRYKVRRALREAESLGGVKLDLAGTPQEASQFLDELKAMHQKAWTTRGKPGSFANRFFSEFHADLVARSGEEGYVQLVRLRVGSQPVGYIYNFVHRRRVYYYQSGFDFSFSSSAAWRPGVVCHTQAIELSRERGLDVYDFMAGDHVYKKELGGHAAEMAWVTLQRPRLKFRIEACLRDGREKWRRAADTAAALMLSARMTATFMCAVAWPECAW